MNRSQAATPIQHTIAVYQVVQMLQAIDGEDARAAVLRRAGILPALLESKLARVTQTQFARLMTALVRHHRQSLLGAVVRQPIHLHCLVLDASGRVGHHLAIDLHGAGKNQGLGLTA
mgnify:CR=1 FL=1